MNDRSTPSLVIAKKSDAAWAAEKPRSLWMDSIYRLSRNPGSIAGAIILTALIVAVILAPFITQYNPIEITPKERLKPPSTVHWMGTDSFGRDIFTRVLYGGQISLRVGIIAVLIALLVGVPMGLMAGFYGGRFDTLIMRVVDIMLSFPGILLALVVIAILGPSLTNVMVAVGISAVPIYARVARGSVLKIKEEMFAEAALLLGCSNRRIMFVHIFPNILGPIIVVATLGVAGAIISGAALSFLGLGATPPTPEWGLMLSEGRNYLRQAWWISTFPGLAIMVTVLSINLLGDGLRDAFDPRMKIN
jgi:peptide/nickel transport system permease protein